RLRKRKASKDLPLVMLTSLALQSTEDSRELFEAFLIKPVKPSRLYNELHQIFSERKKGTPEVITTAQAAVDFEIPKIRVLVADDNNSNQRVAQLSLERLGLRADTVGNGVEVLDALQRHPYDVILMDVHMPELDGVEATRKIRSTIQPDKQPYIIAVTANATVQDRAECLESGMNDYISKPYRLLDLRRVLRRYVVSLEKAGRIPVSIAGASAQSGGDTQVTPHAEQQSELTTEALPRLMEMLDTEDKRKVGEFIDEYLPELKALLDRARAASETSAVGDLTRALHSLKGNARTLGASELAVSAKMVESSVTAGDLAGVSEKIRNLEELYQQFIRTLARIRKDW
ncbi:MAG: response regulator, partial [Nannocystaceae bacterium]